MSRSAAGKAGVLLGGSLLAGLLLLGAGCGKEPQQPSKPATAPVAAPATRPTGPLPANASCMTAQCHASYATANHIHGPVAQKSCSSCHEADIGGHRYPLKRSGNATCTFCHSVTGQHKNQHAAVTQQGCISCHDPHASRTKFILKADSVQLLCTKCHDVPLRKYAHEPFAAGQCTLCHDPHESDTNKLLRGGDGPEHCFMCHTDLKKSMSTARKVHKPAGRNCQQCHNPHSTDNPRELVLPPAALCLDCHDDVQHELNRAKVRHSAVTDGRGCANCHNPHAGQDKNLLPARMDQTCATCHSKPITTKDGRVIKPVAAEVLGKNLHGPIRNGDCASCHRAHGGANDSLLRQPFPKSFYAPFAEDNYALCFSCHSKDMVLEPQTTSLTGFRNGSRNLHYVHVNREDKGRSCKSCHEIHGSDLPKHMASEVPFEGSKWAMPMNVEINPEGGSCTPGCHGKFSYSRSAPTTMTTTRPAGGGQQ